MRLVILLIFVSAHISFSQSVNYSLRMTKPQSHYYEVEMELSNFKEKELTVKMPVWAPGSYLVREFSKNVNMVKAFDEKGTELKVEKTAKNAWKITKGSAKKVKVNYEVYAFELSVRTSFLDLSHAFVSGSGVFCYVDGHKGPGYLDVYPYKNFKTISTSLPESGEEIEGENAKRYTYDNYDLLVDSPLEIGNQDVFYFNVGGTNHQVALYGMGNYDMAQLKIDMEKIVAAANDVFGGTNPNTNYTFIIHNVIDGQGGLEHAKSCVLSVNRWTYSEQEYNEFLNLVAHEYFHLWNVKRIRPIELGPFDYDKENYTSLLWVMEGWTSYYADLLMVRAGFYSKEDFLRSFQGNINYVEGTVGTRVQPVAHASYDAWIKAYRPNENSSNTTMTYYTRGSVLAAYLDAMIVDKFDSKKSLDDYMQYLFNEFYIKKNRGFSEAEFHAALETFMGQDMDFFFDRFVNGTEAPDFQNVFPKVGLNINYTGKPLPSFGATFAQENGKCIVKSVRAGGSAEASGISVGDEIIGCNGLRIDKTTLDNFIASLIVGEYCEVVVAREQIIFNLKVNIEAYERPSYKLETISPSNEKFYYWLRSLH